MSSEQNLADAVAIKKLAEGLDRLQPIRKFDSDTDKQAWTIAHALSDIEDSSLKLVRVCIPRLVKQAQSQEEILSALHDVGEELRHILYHVKDTRFFAYLVDE